MKEFADPALNLWDRNNRKILHHTPIFDLVSYDVTHPKSKLVKPYFILETKSWVNSIALTPSNDIILVRQYRHGLHEYSLELPGGVVDELGIDSVFQSAKRELAEETGYTSTNWKYFSKVSGNPAIFNNWSYTYIAENCEKSQDVDWDEGEDIEIILSPLENIYDLIRGGEIHHPMMVSSLSQFIIETKIQKSILQNTLN